ncbi:hypothetical protein N7481_006221 [Penicillium waksmanii]|uniref:uncharacterized protein n=1 Tax=Penicillium waksmanii TaxID=69791 RepID=UPI0025492BCF|nr:uncharacterized protein N7481_006221 [Penicillium waksmanii]KAJ5984122.1 hypothetical protein N7481_006221 [Penicillium waksmanii]
MQPPVELSFLLPPPVNLVSWREHPNANEIAELSDIWAREALPPLFMSTEALNAFLKTRASQWILISYPSANQERLLVYHKLSQYLGVLHDRVPTKIPPLALPFIELWDQMAPGMADGVRARFVDDVEHMLAGFEKEVSLRTRGDLNDEEYLCLRRQTIGLRQCITFVEYGLGIDLSEVFAAHPSLTTVRDLSIEQMIFYHEILSFRKEYYSGDIMNIIAIWAGKDLSQLQSAVDRAHALAVKAERGFVDLRDEISAAEWGQRDDVQSFLNEVGHIMAGGLHFEYTSPRYNGVGHIWNGSTSGTLILTPDRTIFP